MKKLENLCKKISLRTFCHSKEKVGNECKVLSAMCLYASTNGSLDQMKSMVKQEVVNKLQENGTGAA